MGRPYLCCVLVLCCGVEALLWAGDTVVLESTADPAPKTMTPYEEEAAQDIAVHESIDALRAKVAEVESEAVEKTQNHQAGWATGLGDNQEEKRSEDNDKAQANDEGALEEGAGSAAKADEPKVVSQDDLLAKFAEEEPKLAAALEEGAGSAAKADEPKVVSPDDLLAKFAEEEPNLAAAVEEQAAEQVETEEKKNEQKGSGRLTSQSSAGPASENEVTQLDETLGRDQPVVPDEEAEARYTKAKHKAEGQHAKAEVLAERAKEAEQVAENLEAEVTIADSKASPEEASKAASVIAEKRVSESSNEDQAQGTGKQEAGGTEEQEAGEVKKTTQEELVELFAEEQPEEVKKIEAENSAPKAQQDALHKQVAQKAKQRAGSGRLSKSKKSKK